MARDKFHQNWLNEAKFESRTEMPSNPFAVWRLCENNWYRFCSHSYELIMVIGIFRTLLDPLMRHLTGRRRLIKISELGYRRMFISGFHKETFLIRLSSWFILLSSGNNWNKETCIIMSVMNCFLNEYDIQYSSFCLTCTTVFVQESYRTEN